MSIDSLYYENELQYKDINKQKYAEFITQLYHIIGTNLDSFIPTDDIDSNDYQQRFLYVKYLVLTYLSQYKNEFYKLLEQFGYHMQYDIIDLLRVIGKEEDLGVKDILSYVRKSPHIQDIETNGEVITIKSDTFGVYRVIGVRNYLKDNIDAYSLFTYGDVSSLSHQLATTLLHEMDNTEIIISLIPAPFKGTYYHSYIKDSSGMIIDGANQLVIDEPSYNNLFKPDQIMKCTRCGLYEEYKKVAKNINESEREKYPIPVIVTLNKQLTLGAK